MFELDFDTERECNKWSHNINLVLSKQIKKTKYKKRVKDQQQHLSQINKVVAFFDIQKDVQTKLKDVSKLLEDQSEI